MRSSTTFGGPSSFLPQHRRPSIYQFREEPCFGFTDVKDLRDVRDPSAKHDGERDSVFTGLPSMIPTGAGSRPTKTKRAFD